MQNVFLCLTFFLIFLERGRAIACAIDMTQGWDLNLKKTQKEKVKIDKITKIPEYINF